MSMTCALCAKKATRANHVSHSKVRVPRMQLPNLQTLNIAGKRVRVCTTCRRTLAKKAA